MFKNISNRFPGSFYTPTARHLRVAGLRKRIKKVKRGGPIGPDGNLRPPPIWNAEDRQNAIEAKLLREKQVINQLYIYQNLCISIISVNSQIALTFRALLKKYWNLANIYTIYLT